MNIEHSESFIYHSNLSSSVVGAIKYTSMNINWLWCGVAHRVTMSHAHTNDFKRHKCDYDFHPFYNRQTCCSPLVFSVAAVDLVQILPRTHVLHATCSTIFSCFPHDWLSLTWIYHNQCMRRAWRSALVTQVGSSAWLICFLALWRSICLSNAGTDWLLRRSIE